ncbi:MAG: AI-2E family transporter [Acidobacteriota bacterium]|nr:AI-2E family transporter [Acidobacteriota bacterium]
METTLQDKPPVAVADGKPDVTATARLFEGSMGIRSIALTGLFILACFYTLYFGREFFLPISLAFVFTFLLSPIVRALKTVHIPESLGAALVILGCLGSLGFIGYELSGPLTEWMEKAPEISQKLQGHLRNLKKPVEKITQAGEQVQELAKVGAEEKKPPQRVELKQAGFGDGLFSWTWSFLFGLMVMVILLYFLLGSGDLFLRKLIHVLPRFEDKKTAVQIARKIEDHVSKYLLTVALINAGLGTAGGLAFWALGMPNPMLWGTMAALLNFIPYVGALTVIMTVGLVATATFGSVSHALLVPAVYFVLATLEGNFITPWILGRRLTLNPVVIFIGLTFWGWLWGIVGVLIAVPMLVTFKIFCDHIEPLAPIGEFLGD